MDSSKNKVKNAKDNEQRAKVRQLLFNFSNMNYVSLSYILLFSLKLNSNSMKLNTTKSTKSQSLFLKRLSKNM